MERNVFCQLSKTDGSTLQLWLSEEQVAVMTDNDNPERMVIFEALGIVSIEVDQTAKETQVAK